MHIGVVEPYYRRTIVSLGNVPTVCHPTQTQQKRSNCRLIMYIAPIDSSKCLFCSTVMYSLQSHTMLMFLIQYSPVECTQHDLTDAKTLPSARIEEHFERCSKSVFDTPDATDVL